jgi:hypothetical protein
MITFLFDVEKSRGKLSLAIWLKQRECVINYEYFHNTYFSKLENNLL